MFQGVIDRIEDNYATILIESLHKELIVHERELPEGCKEGIWLNIEKAEESFKVISINQEMTSDKQRQSEQLMNKLKSRKRTSQFKRK